MEEACAGVELVPGTECADFFAGKKGEDLYPFFRVGIRGIEPELVELVGRGLFGVEPDIAFLRLAELAAVGFGEQGTGEGKGFAAAFAPGSKAEIGIIADLPELGDGARVSGRIDRLAVTDGEVLAIDFKTNRPPPTRLEEVPAIYVRQMALYRLALAKLFPNKRVACALVWTEGPRLMPIPAEILDKEASRLRSA